MHSYDPHDPQLIFDALPERERDRFVREYRHAAEAAREISGYRQLQEFLDQWSHLAAAYSSPGFYEAREHARTGTGERYTLDDVAAGRRR